MADDLDVITLSAAKSAVNMSGDNVDHKVALEKLVTAVSRRLDEIIGPIVAREVTEYHSGGQCMIWPHQTPVLSVTTLTMHDGTTPTTLTEDTFGTHNANGFIIDTSGSYAHDARIIRRSSGTPTYFDSGHRNVELVYQAGRAADTDAVDARIAEAAGEILSDIWNRESPKWAQSSAFLATVDEPTVFGPRDAFRRRVEELLGDEMKTPGIA